jgi:hypothetical protein
VIRACCPALLLSITLLWAGLALAANPLIIDLATTPATDTLLRAHGHTGTGSSGVPVAGGHDMDGDEKADFAFSSLHASPLGRSNAGEVYLIFGDGEVDGTLDTGVANADILTIIGDQTQEHAGSEIWMDEVTDDEFADLLIARQNYTPDAQRAGAGALTIIAGSAGLRTFAAGLVDADLRTPPGSFSMTTIVGAGQQFRLGIWMRTGDVTGDGIADIVVGSDQTTELGETHRGAIYVIRGGTHLAATQTIDLENFGTTALAGHIAKVTPPADSDEFHFGATVQIADLDGNGSAEVLAAAALNRAGATLPPAGAPGPTHGSGGSGDGTLFIAWDDNFTGSWDDGFEFEIGSGPGSYTAIEGAACNRSFGEEIVGGLDYDGNGSADLFVGDIVGNCGPKNKFNAGSGHVFFDAADLKGADFDLQSPPVGLVITDIFGAAEGDISSDTAFQGDYDGDGHADLGIASPHHSPQGRGGAGTLHIFFGQPQGWPAAIDLAAVPAASVLRVTRVDGANGLMGSDTGDTLGYSAASGDIDGDGIADIIANEMVGNGLQPGSVDVGNLIILSGAFVAPLPVPALGALGAALSITLLAGVAAHQLGRRKRE